MSPEDQARITANEIITSACNVWNIERDSTLATTGYMQVKWEVPCDPYVNAQPTPGEQYVDEQVEGFTNPYSDEFILTRTTTTAGTMTHIHEPIRDIMLWLGANESHDVPDELEACNCLPPTVDPQEMESSSPLRADDDDDDTMGAAFDSGCEMGEAEEWFRDKIRVR